MWDFLDRLFGQGFMPHGHCYLWTPSMVWTQVVSNLLIGLAYASITATLLMLVRKIRGVPFAWAYVAFGAFILSCGVTHLFDVATVWHPVYWADAGVRVITAVASVGTAVLIVPLVPQAVALAEDARVSRERGKKLEVAYGDLEIAHAKALDLQNELSRREREAQERALVSEEQFRLLVETMPQLAWVSAPDGANLFRNARWAEVTGVPLEQIKEAHWESLHDPETLPTARERWTRSLATGEPFEVEARLRTASGGYHWFLARARPLRDKSGAIIRWFGTLTDIEDQRAARESALRTAAMKDEFLATVSHELRTPLNAILGWSRMLRSGALPEESREKAIEAIERNSVAQAQLIDDLLDISRIAAGKLRLDLASVQPSELIDAAVDSVRPTADAKGVRLSAVLDRAAGPIMADGARLQQILNNLLTNAIKFTPCGGRVNVTLSRVRSHVEIAVEDTGIGIRPDFLPYVFERFTQAESSIGRTQSGLGLGLAITKYLVEQHGGTIEALSDGLERGSTFLVRFPLTAVRPASAEDALAAAPLDGMKLDPPAILKGLRVLVVEDELDSRELLAAILAQCESEVVQVANGEDALVWLENAVPDVIISDIGLPGLNGYELIARIRKDPRLSRVPAAALTAFARAEDRRKTLQSGYQMHVPKPVEPLELVEVVANLARIGRAMNP